MAYIPLDIQEQRKGKAIIDGIGSRAGKSGGAIIYQALMMFCASIAIATPYIAVMVFVLIFLWIYSIFGLNREIKARSKSNSM